MKKCASKSEKSVINVKRVIRKPVKKALNCGGCTGSSSDKKDISSKLGL